MILGATGMASVMLMFVPLLGEMMGIVGGLYARVLLLKQI
jgi:hypothetical protein